MQETRGLLSGVVGHFGDTMRWVREVIAGRLPTVGATVRDMCARRFDCSAPLAVGPLSAWGRGRSDITCVGCVKQSPCRFGLPRLGRYGDTIGLGWDNRTDGRSGDTMVQWVACVLHRDACRAARDALRYHVAGVQVVRDKVRAGVPTVGTSAIPCRMIATHCWGYCIVGTLRRYHGQWVGICLAYGCRTALLGTHLRYHAVAWIGPSHQWLGRFGDTKRYHCAFRSWHPVAGGLANDLHVVLVGAARDALRYHAVVYVVVRGLYRRFGEVCTRMLGWAFYAGNVLHLYRQKKKILQREVLASF